MIPEVRAAIVFDEHGVLSATVRSTLVVGARSWDSPPLQGDSSDNAANHVPQELPRCGRSVSEAASLRSGRRIRKGVSSRTMVRCNAAGCDEVCCPDRVSRTARGLDETLASGSISQESWPPPSAGSRQPFDARGFPPSEPFCNEHAIAKPRGSAANVFNQVVVVRMTRHWIASLRESVASGTVSSMHQFIANALQGDASTRLDADVGQIPLSKKNEQPCPWIPIPRVMPS